MEESADSATEVESNGGIHTKGIGKGMCIHQMQCQGQQNASGPSLIIAWIILPAARLMVASPITPVVIASVRYLSK